MAILLLTFLGFLVPMTAGLHLTAHLLARPPTRAGIGWLSISNLVPMVGVHAFISGLLISPLHLVELGSTLDYQVSLGCSFDQSGFGVLDQLVVNAHGIYSYCNFYKVVKY